MGGCVSNIERKNEEEQKKRMMEKMRQQEEMECKLERRNVDLSFKPQMELRPSGIKNPKPTTDFGF